MGIYLPNMEMPRWCCSCELNVDDTYCCVTETAFSDNERIKEGFDYQEKRLPNCPLIEVPPHGRLIDRDAIDYYEVERNGEKHYMVWKPHIDGMPTIIEAEKDND